MDGEIIGWTDKDGFQWEIVNEFTLRLPGEEYLRDKAEVEYHYGPLAPVYRRPSTSNE